MGIEQFENRQFDERTELAIKELEGLFGVLSGNSHYHNKIDAGQKFRELSQPLIDQGLFGSEKELEDFLKSRTKETE